MILKPPALRPGATIGLVAPGSALPTGSLAQGMARLRSLGYEVRHSPGIMDIEGTFAGSHQRRAGELLEMLEDPSIDAVLCARGGYGCNYLIPFLTEKPLPPPKIVMGYSDVTTLHAFLWSRARWVTFHGPMVAIDSGLEIGPALTSTQGWEAGCAAEVLAPGAAEGRLLGGCLSIALTTLGTSREIDWRDAIVFLEDIGEAPYRIDRMLFHLREAGKFEGVKGLLFGEMKDCGQPDLLRHFEKMGIPVASGFPSGHVSGANTCIPLGVRARLDSGRLTILEGAVR